MQRADVLQVFLGDLWCCLEDILINSPGRAHIAPCDPGVAAGAVLTGSPASLTFARMERNTAFAAMPEMFIPARCAWSRNPSGRVIVVRSVPMHTAICIKQDIPSGYQI